MITMISHNPLYCNRYSFLVFAFIASIVFTLTGCGTMHKEIVLNSENLPPVYENALNINTASAEELEKIPHIGEKFALKIVEHRSRHGRFRRPEHLMLIPGISDKRFREIRHLIRVD